MTINVKGLNILKIITAIKELLPQKKFCITNINLKIMLV
tara:strand:+ start:701 stop:817 length:117 start_codon:yes stop_codon:yes gene_type:complete